MDRTGPYATLCDSSLPMPASVVQWPDHGAHQDADELVAGVGIRSRPEGPRWIRCEGHIAAQGKDTIGVVLSRATTEVVAPRGLPT